MTLSVGLSVFSGLGDATIPYLDTVAGPFDSLWFPDHLQSNEVGVMEGWTLLAYALARYPTKRCGHQVLCNEFRHPAVLAKMAATAQVLSGGRFILGLGAGWHQDEADAYGIDFPATPVRVERMGETVEIARLIWSGERVSYDGVHHRLLEAECLPAPQPAPLVMIGGSGERYVLGAVARHADMWNHIYRGPEEFRSKLSVLEEHCSRVGRDPAAIVPVLGTQVVIASSQPKINALREGGGVRSVAMNGIAGTPDQVAEALLEGVAAGAGAIIVGFADSPRTDGAELFAEAVLPALRAG